MDETAIKLVRKYLEEHFETHDVDIVFVVWKCKTLQNWEYILGTTYAHMLFELTYYGDKEEWYLDVYNKVENKVIKASEDF